MGNLFDGHWDRLMNCVFSENMMEIRPKVTLKRRLTLESVHASRLELNDCLFFSLITTPNVSAGRVIQRAGYDSAW